VRDIADVAQDPRRERAEALTGVRFVRDEAGEGVERDDAGDALVGGRSAQRDEPGRSLADEYDLPIGDLFEFFERVQETPDVMRPLTEQRATEPKAPLGCIGPLCLTATQILGATRED
jgi:hypothetical protein